MRALPRSLTEAALPTQANTCEPVSKMNASALVSCRRKIYKKEEIERKVNNMKKGRGEEGESYGWCLPYLERLARTRVCQKRH